MINLLPTDVKQNYGYARRSTKLARLAMILVFSIFGVAFIVASGLFYMNSSIKSYTKQNAQAQQSLKDQKLEETQKEVQNISNSLKLAVQVLSKEILFSKLITQIGANMPAFTVLTDLSIPKTEGAIDLTANSVNYGAATQIQINLQDPANKIFDKVDIVSITCVARTNPQYPCTVKMRAQFAKNNPFLFINNEASTKQ